MVYQIKQPQFFHKTSERFDLSTQLFKNSTFQLTSLQILPSNSPIYRFHLSTHLYRFYLSTHFFTDSTFQLTYLQIPPFNSPLKILPFNSLLYRFYLSTHFFKDFIFQLTSLQIPSFNSPLYRSPSGRTCSVSWLCEHPSPACVPSFSRISPCVVPTTH